MTLLEANFRLYAEQVAETTCSSPPRVGIKKENAL